MPLGISYFSFWFGAFRDYLADMEGGVEAVGSAAHFCIATPTAHENPSGQAFQFCRTWRRDDAHAPTCSYCSTTYSFNYVSRPAPIPQCIRGQYQFHSAFEETLSLSGFWARRFSWRKLGNGLIGTIPVKSKVWSAGVPYNWSLLAIYSFSGVGLSDWTQL